MSRRSGKLYIGTSGWSYSDWKKDFYPEKISSDKFLGYYATRFDTTEINNTFYHLPDLETVQNWKDTVPREFIFSVKASRYITHVKKLKGPPQEAVNKLFEHIKPLGEHCGPLLFQLPPHWHANSQRLKEFLEILPGGYRYAFELRDSDWFNEGIYQVLQEHRAAFCVYDMAGKTSPCPVTADFVYLRLHGPGHQKYSGEYGKRRLENWRKVIQNWLDDGLDVYVYFDNTEKSAAPKDAETLKQLTS